MALARWFRGYLATVGSHVGENTERSGFMILWVIRGRRRQSRAGWRRQSWSSSDGVDYGDVMCVSVCVVCLGVRCCLFLVWIQIQVRYIWYSTSSREGILRAKQQMNSCRDISHFSLVLLGGCFSPLTGPYPLSRTERVFFSGANPLVSGVCSAAGLWVHDRASSMNGWCSVSFKMTWKDITERTMIIR